jgi:hypothetical protein
LYEGGLTEIEKTPLNKQKPIITPKTRMTPRWALIGLGIILFLMVGSNNIYLVSCRPLTPSKTTPQDTTIPLQDTTAPAISKINIMGYTGETATITWETDEDATSQVEYGETDTYGKLATSDLEFTTVHSIELTGLQPNTTSHFSVKSTDKSGNQNESGNQSFTNWVAEKDWAKYVNEEYGFSVQYPRSWKEDPKLLTGPYHVAGFRVPNYLPGLVIVVFEADEPMSAEWIVESFKESGNKDIKIVSPQTETTLADGTKAITYKAQYSSLIAPPNLATSYCLDADRNNERIRIIVFTLEYYEPYNEAMCAQIAHTLRFSAE